MEEIKVLLVDDEKVILDIGGELLDAMGYHVITAQSGNEAIEIVRKLFQKEAELPGVIDLVILDMVMPKMGGGETVLSTTKGMSYRWARRAIPSRLSTLHLGLPMLSV